MIKLLISILLLLGGFANIVEGQSSYYISTTGNNANPGSLYQPFLTWEFINTIYKDGRFKPGDTVFIRGGVYRTTYGNGRTNHVLLSNIQGNAEKKIVIMAFPREFPVLMLDDINTTYKDPTGLKIEHCVYMHLKGLRISGLGQVENGKGLSRGMDIYDSKNCIFELMEVDHIGGYGLILGDSTVRNLFLNIDIHHIYDSLTVKDNWNNANGINCTGGSTADNDTFRYCRTWKCSDDGFDFYKSNGNFILQGCWSFWNGYKPNNFQSAGDGSGFKLGPAIDYPNRKKDNQRNTVLRVITNCIAFENRLVGFNQNNGEMKYIMFNNTSFHNGNSTFGYGFMWDYIHPAPIQDFKNNISYKDLYPRRGQETEGSNNSWCEGFKISSCDFVSLNSAGMDERRNPDGSLPILQFLRLKRGSPLIDAGIKVGLPYKVLPDLGAFEFEE
ncbi:MAG: hypothetical protein ABIO04_09675 [Ferruginibacter sp.]